MFVIAIAHGREHPETESTPRQHKSSSIDNRCLPGTEHSDRLNFARSRIDCKQKQVRRSAPSPTAEQFKMPVKRSRRCGAPLSRRCMLLVLVTICCLEYSMLTVTANPLVDVPTTSRTSGTTVLTSSPTDEPLLLATETMREETQPQYNSNRKLQEGQASNVFAESDSTGSFFAEQTNANELQLSQDAPTASPTAVAVIQSARPLLLELDFALWFPAATVLPVNGLIQAGVLQALLELLCTETDMHVMDQSTHQDVCILNNYESRRRHLQAQQPPTGPYSVLQQDDISIETKMLQDPVELTYFVWTIQYTAISVGDTYIQNALQADATLLLDNVKLLERAVQGMQQTVQLALDLSVMERAFERLLNEHVASSDWSDRPSSRLYCSPVGREASIFGEIQQDMQVPKAVYSTSPWNAMRISGLSLLWTVVSGTATLVWLAGKRRKRIDQIVTRDSENTTSTFMLQSPEGVNSLLDCSVSFRVPRGVSVGMPLSDSARLARQQEDATDDDSEQDGGNTLMPLPIALQ